ncbi:MAG: hypothetical protein HYY29_04470 [Chloroflexi bacterium]|nr:hypothetical protein [Chloroflexota bacterium]
MRLELCSFPVKNIVFNGQSAYRDGVVSLSRPAAVALLKEDKRIGEVDLDIVHPGDEVRIVAVRGISEPRIKSSGPGCVFPGIMCPPATAGEGVTHRLADTAIVTTAYYGSQMRSGTGAPSASFLDMWGAGAEVTPFGATHNVVMSLNLVDGLSEPDAHDAIQGAQFKLGQHLAATTLGLEAPQKEVFELTPVDPALPRVVYVLICVTTQFTPHPGHSLYGQGLQESSPTLMHPNEFFDGAVVRDARHGQSNYPMNWHWLNQPIIKGLYQNHGKTLNFLGVIFHRTSFTTHTGKEVGALLVAQMARMIGAQAAVVTRMGTSGNKFVDAMLNVQALEQKGIKTVFVTPEYGGQRGDELPLIYTVPQADAIISTGSQERPINVSAPKRVIGPPGHAELLDLDRTPGRNPPPADTALALDGWDRISGGIDWWGGNYFKCVEY